MANELTQAPTHQCIQTHISSIHTELQLFSTTELEQLATQKIVQKKNKTEFHNLPIQLLDQDLQKSCELLLLFSANKIFFV